MRSLCAFLRGLSDADLAARTRDAAAKARQAVALRIACLAELEARGLHLAAGYGSLFLYCRDVLALSEDESFGSVVAARAARRFPVVLGRLAEGALSLATVKLLAPHLTPDNHGELLEAARGKSKAQLEELVARLWPLPDVPSSVRKLRPRGVALAVPLAPDRYQLQVTVNGDTFEKLRLARDLLRHAVPRGDDATVVERALTALLADLARARFAATDRPRAPRGTTPGSRHVPAEVKRAVFVRDLGRCAYVSGEGRRCDERGFVEFHHLRPHAVGGEATVENIQLRCRRHNQYEAERYFRREEMDDGVREGRAGYAVRPARGRGSRPATGRSSSTA